MTHGQVMDYYGGYPKGGHHPTIAITLDVQMLYTSLWILCDSHAILSLKHTETQVCVKKKHHNLF